MSDVDTIGRFMLACLTKARGEETAVRAIYARCQNWCAEQAPDVAALEVAVLAEQFAARCKRLGFRARQDGATIVCVGVMLISSTGCNRPDGSSQRLKRSGSVRSGIPREGLTRTKGEREEHKLANDLRDTRALRHYLGQEHHQTVRYTELSPERFKKFWED